ncbi:hypothetical protein AB0A95_34510 [Micromonospora sp. NPDC049230]|uniref:hypothetical protein n=1 Tax=Micromonospora sp. NPDC049230 TaxID=3155502 RepID=UPI0034075AFC
MKKLMIHAAAAGIATSALVFVGAAPASADLCASNKWATSHTSTRTIATMNENGCSKVAARVDRYSGSQVYTHSTPWQFKVADTGDHQEGVGAGNAARSYNGQGAYPGWVWL